MAKAGSTEKVVREIRRGPPRASQTNAVEGVLTGALGRPGRLRSVHGCGAHAGGSQAVPRLLRDRARDLPRDHRRDRHPQPYGAWMEQLARNLTDPVEGCLRTASHLIHDRDPLYTRVFGEILTGGGVQPIRLPPKSPNLNAYAERFVRSIKGVGALIQRGGRAVAGLLTIATAGGS